MTLHTPYQFTTSGGSPDKIWLDGKVIAQLSNTTYAVANHIVTCLNSQAELVEALERLCFANSDDEADYPDRQLYLIVQDAVKKGEAIITQATQ